MLTIPLAIVMVFLHFHFADERAANRAAHELCPSTHVVRADDEFRFGCKGQQYAVQCEGRFRKECNIEAL